MAYPSKLNIIKPRNNIFTRMPLGGLQAAATFGGYTGHIVAKLAAKPYAVRIAMPNLTTGQPINVGSFGFDNSFGALSSSQDKGSLVSTWYPLTWDGATSAISELRASSSQPSWVWSDWIPCSPPDLADGSNGAIIHVNTRQGIAAGDATWWSGLWTPSAPTEAVALHKWRCYRSTDASVDYATTSQGSFAGSVQGGGCQTCMIQYASIIPGHTMLVCGDSISSGVATGATMVANGYGWHAKTRDLISTNDLPIEVCNLGWSGQTMAQAIARYKDVAAAIKDAILFHMNWTPNGMSSPLTAANVDTNKSNFSDVLRLANENRCVPILQTSTPANAAAVDGGSGGASAKSYGSGDPLRIAYDTEIKRAAISGYVFDVTPLLSGAAVPSGTAIGQIEYNQAYTNASLDGLHPNDAGYTAWANGLSDFLRGKL